MKNFQLQSSFVILSGASSGIGFEIAKILIENYNATVLGLARNEEKLFQTRKTLGESFIPFKMDVSIESEWQRLADFLSKTKLQCDVLINNAGVLPPFDKTINVSVEELSKTFQTNFFSCVYSAKHILPILKNSEKACFVNVSSSSSVCTVIGQSAYSASKSALKAWTETLILEEKDCHVSLIIPGFCKTPIFDKFSLSQKDQKLLNLVSSKPQNMAKKIVKCIKKRKKIAVLGCDAKLMNFFYKLFPKTFPRLVAKILKKSKLKMFNSLFEE